VTPRDILARLEREGIALEPKLTINAEVEPTPETLELLRTHRDDMLRFLLTKKNGLLIELCRSTEELQRGSIWCIRCFRYHQNPCSPSEKVFGNING
jgi:hypothetical protein